MRFLSGVFCACFAALSASALAASPVATTVDAAAADFMARQHVPGVAIALVEHGRVVYAHGYGLANVRDNVPVTVDTRFEIGSITKQFTAAGILQQVRAGKLSLDDPLAKYLAIYPAANAVTVRQLLSHTSGIPEYLDGPDVVKAAGTVSGTLETIVGRIANKPLNFLPGTKWAYSNTNYILLGRILEIASGEPYDRYVRDHLFAPAQMSHSGFISDEKALPSMAIGYKRSATGVVPGDPLRSEWAGSAGAIVSTVGDLAKWDDALAQGAIVAPADAALMESAVIPAGNGAYGFGWFIDAVGGHKRVWHNGGTFGFTATNTLYPSDDQAIIVLENLAETTPETAATAIFSALHADVAAKIAADQAPVGGEDAAITAKARDWLHRFQTGTADRSQMTENAAKLFTPELLASAKEQFAQIGSPSKLVFRGKTVSGPYNVYKYAATFELGTFTITMALDPDGKLAAYSLTPQ